MELRKANKEISFSRILEEDEEFSLGTKKLKISEERQKITSRAKVQKGKDKEHNVEDQTDSDYEPNGYVKKPKRKTEKISKPAQETGLNFLLSWRTTITLPEFPQDDTFKIVKCSQINSLTLHDHASNLQALYINILWKDKENNRGKTLEDLKKIEITSKLMKNGIIFIWAEKELIGEIMKIMDKKGLVYIENFVVVLLSMERARQLASAVKNGTQKYEKPSNEKPSKPKIQKITQFFQPKVTKPKVPDEDKDSIETICLRKKNSEMIQSNLNNINPQSVLLQGEYQHFSKSKRLLLMFRKNESKNNENLELRHQRTSDVVFDIAPDSNYSQDLDPKVREYIYKMIETLLPKANYSEEAGYQFKMMELWADTNTPRKGWVSVCEASD